MNRTDLIWRQEAGLYVTEFMLEGSIGLHIERESTEPLVMREAPDEGFAFDLTRDWDRAHEKVINVTLTDEVDKLIRLECVDPVTIAFTF